MPKDFAKDINVPSKIRQLGLFDITRRKLQTTVHGCFKIIRCFCTKRCPHFFLRGEEGTERKIGHAPETLSEALQSTEISKGTSDDENTNVALRLSQRLSEGFSLYTCACVSVFIFFYSYVSIFMFLYLYRSLCFYFFMSLSFYVSIFPYISIYVSIVLSYYLCVYIFV